MSLTIYISSYKMRGVNIMKKGQQIMPKKPDESLKNKAGYYQSRYDTSKEFNKNNYDVLTIRVPKGTKDALKEYQERMNQTEPENPKYSSINALVKALLESETGITLN